MTFLLRQFSDIQKSKTIAVNASEGGNSAVSPVVYKSERLNVLAPDLDGHVVVDNPVNRRVDVKCENAATRIDERFCAAKNVSSDPISIKLCLNETPDASTEKSGSAPNVCLANVRRMRTPACIFV